MKRICLLTGFIAILILLMSCSKQPKVDHVTEFSRDYGDYVLSIKFNLEKGYKAMEPIAELTPEELEKQIKLREENFSQSGDYEIFKDDILVAGFSTVAAIIPETLPSFYEQALAKAKADGTLIDEGTTDIFDFCLVKKEHPNEPGKMRYVYYGQYKQRERGGFSISSDSQDEAEKIFESMVIEIRLPPNDETVSADTTIQETKDVVSGQLSWANVELSDAIEQSELIVYGQVISKSDTLAKITEPVDLHEELREQNPDVDIPVSMGFPFANFYTDLTIRVDDVIMGDSDRNEAHYYEWGGIYENILYEYGNRHLAVGDHVLIFLRDNQSLITDDYVMVEQDGTLNVPISAIPDAEVPDDLPENQFAINYRTEDYIILLREVIKEVK